MMSPAAVERRISMMETKRERRESCHIQMNPERTIIHAEGADKIYIPTGTGNLAHLDNSFVRVIMGPYGSGKSTWAISEIVRRACAMPVWSSGRRRSRWGIVRNTSGELQSTTLATWLAWFGDLGDMRKRQKPIMTYEHVFNDGHGIIELELIFIALDRPEDIRKIKSLELTGCYINELSEVPKAAMAHMKGRVNRYPSKAFCTEPYWSGIIADTNPPEDDHWIYKDFEEAKFDGHKLFKQPPGLLKNEDGKWVRNREADNADHLPDDYYEKLAEGQSLEFIKVFCLGEYGSVGFGKRVFPEFNPDFHAFDSLTAIQGHPIILGWDFGLTPACVVMQLTPRGQLMILKEYVGDGIGIRSFADSIVIPGLGRDFPYCRVGQGMSIGDPAGVARSEVMEEMSCIGELCSLGIETIAARTNDLDPRLGSIRYFLNKMVDGKPGCALDRKKCPILFKGFVKDYIYMRVAVSGEERYKDKPHKNMSSHCFVGETLVLTPSGYKKIKDLKINEYVCTPLGNKKITATMSRLSNNLIELKFSNKKTIRCTKDHPFYTPSGLVEADALSYNDVLLSIGSDNLKSWTKNKNIQHKNLMGLNIIGKLKGIIRLVLKSMGSQDICIGMSGNSIMAQFPTSITFITSMKTEVTMTYLTYLVSMAKNIIPITRKRCIKKTPLEPKNTWMKLGFLLVNGINLMKEKNFIKELEEYHGINQKKNILVFNVMKNLCVLLAQIKEVFVPKIARLKQEENQEWTTKKENALSALRNLFVTSIKKPKHVLKVVGKNQFQEQKNVRVYDLTVEDAHCFFVEGILVSNCMDALGYGCLEIASDRIAMDKSGDREMVNMWNPAFQWQS